MPIFLPSQKIETLKDKSEEERKTISIGGHRKDVININ